MKGFGSIFQKYKKALEIMLGQKREILLLGELKGFQEEIYKQSQNKIQVTHIRKQQQKDIGQDQDLFVFNSQSTYQQYFDQMNQSLINKRKRFDAVVLFPFQTQQNSALQDQLAHVNHIFLYKEIVKNFLNYSGSVVNILNDSSFLFNKDNVQQNSMSQAQAVSFYQSSQQSYLNIQNRFYSLIFQQEFQQDKNYQQKFVLTLLKMIYKIGQPENDSLTYLKQTKGKYLSPVLIQLLIKYIQCQNIILT